ncbi:MAG: DUF4105 domain-containing protein [Proteobacteria bacterium]|nr:DUF4105 domain-containing protein [Pseudomonadota bacterium]
MNGRSGKNFRYNYIFGLIIFWSFFAFESHSSFIPSKIPKTISLLVLAPGNAFDSSFGHVDLVLSYGDKPQYNDVLVGFGPSADDIGEFDKNITGYQMIVWQNTLLDRFKDALKLERNWIRIIPIKMSEKERANAVELIERYHAHINEIKYFPLNNNCATMVSRIVGQAKGRRVFGVEANYPLTIEASFRRLRWTSWFNNHQYSQKFIQSLELP